MKTFFKALVFSFILGSLVFMIPPVNMFMKGQLFSVSAGPAPMVTSNGRFFVEVTGNETLNSVCAANNLIAKNYPSGSLTSNIGSLFYPSAPVQVQSSGYNANYTCKPGFTAPLSCPAGVSAITLRSCPACSFDFSNSNSPGNQFSSVFGECVQPPTPAPTPTPTPTPTPVTTSPLSPIDTAVKDLYDEFKSDVANNTAEGRLRLQLDYLNTVLPTL